MSNKTCSINDCDSVHFGRGYCRKHYTRWLRTGSASTEPYSVYEKTAKERFLQCCETDENSGCWLWQKSIAGNGYGKAHYQNRSISAHRLSYLLFIGRIPDDAHVLHSCDVRHCVNPDHLRAGTHKENMRDAVSRFRLGKLSEQDVASIKSDPRTTRRIGLDFGVSSATVSEIKRGKSWST